jgi:DNA gyrase/topoisomerase IV subunit B
LRRKRRFVTCAPVPIVTFVPDEDLFGKYHFIPEYVQKMLWNYVFLNTRV